MLTAPPACHLLILKSHGSQTEKVKIEALFSLTAASAITEDVLFRFFCLSFILGQTCSKITPQHSVLQSGFKKRENAVCY